MLLSMLSHQGIPLSASPSFASPGREAPTSASQEDELEAVQEEGGISLRSNNRNLSDLLTPPAINKDWE